MWILRRSVAFCQVVLLILALHATLIFGADRTKEFLNDIKLTHWNDWGVNATCPQQQFVVGVNVKNSEVDGHTSVNGFQLLCSDEINPRNKAIRSASLGRANKGDWKLVKKCKNGFVVGILAVLSSLEVSFPGTSIASLQVSCSDEGGGSNFGNGADQSHFCDTGDAVVGLSVNADSIITIGTGDTAVVKNVMIECKPVTNPANYYNISYVWEKRKGMMKCTDLMNGTDIKPIMSSNQNVDEKSQTISMNCSYNSWTGIGLNPNLHRANHSMETYSSMGLNNNKDFVKWALLRRIMSTESRKWFLQHFQSQPRLLDDFAEEMISADVKNYSGTFPYKIPRYPIPSNLFKKMRSDPNSTLVLKHDPMMEQFVANAGPYQISFALFRANHHVFIETPVNKRMTRIVFEDFDMAKIKKDK